VNILPVSEVSPAVRRLGNNVASVIGTVWILTGCGAGLAPEEPRTTPAATAGAAQGCASQGSELVFTVDQNANSLFWAADARINPGDPATDQSKVKALFDIPQNSLPTGFTNARIQIAPVPSSSLPAGVHVDTAFAISVLSPEGLTSLAPSSGTETLTLAIRYDPVSCDIPPEVEATLLLGRLSANGLWQDVCGDLANPSATVREVACDQGDLSFGIFGVIPATRSQFNDPTPPIFPPGAYNLSGKHCDPSSCGAAPWIDLEWGPATDGGGSGIKLYWIYVDNQKFVSTTNITANPTIRFRVVSNVGGLDTTQTHTYKVSALDNADNESLLFGSLTL
jgi:hypothetical protein